MLSVVVLLVWSVRLLEERRLSTACQTLLPWLVVAQRQAPLVGSTRQNLTFLVLRLELVSTATAGYFSDSASGLVAAANGAPMT